MATMNPQSTQKKTRVERVEHSELRHGYDVVMLPLTRSEFASMMAQLSRVLTENQDQKGTEAYKVLDDLECRFWRLKHALGSKSDIFLTME